MTAHPNTIPDIDQAWQDKLGTLVLTGSGDTLQFFQETPSVDGTPQRAYPSIAIMLIGLVEDSARREGRDDEVQVSEDIGPTPPTSGMIGLPKPYRLVYSVDTWAKGRARDDRELVGHIINTLGDRGFLVDPTTGDQLWAMRTGFTNVDEDDGDVKIYHKAFTYEVLACLGSATVRNAEQATSIVLTFRASGSAPDTPVVDDPDLRTDLTITITG